MPKPQQLIVKPSLRKRVRRNVRLSDRGLGPDGGGWNIPQASAWSGIGEGHLREMAKKHISGERLSFPCHAVGRRIIIAREGFKSWFNARPDPAPQRAARNALSG